MELDKGPYGLGMGLIDGLVSGLPPVCVCVCVLLFQNYSLYDSCKQNETKNNDQIQEMLIKKEAHIALLSHPSSFFLFVVIPGQSRYIRVRVGTKGNMISYMKIHF